MMEHILELYSPAEVLYILHTVQESSGNTLIHLMADTQSEDLIYELQTMLEAFMPFEKGKKSFNKIRDGMIPTELKGITSTKTGKENLWELGDPVDLKNDEMVIAMQKGDIVIYYRAREAAFLKPGNMRYVLSLVYGNTKQGVSIYKAFEESQADREMLDIEVRSFFNWFILPLLEENKKGLTPLQIASKVSKKNPTAFRILSMAEATLGIDTTKKRKGRRSRRSGRRTFADLDNCQPSFQKQK